MKKNAVKLFFALSVALLLLSLACTLIPSTTKNEEIIDGKKKAEIVILAVEQYKTKNGHYPERMNELLPEFLKEIPITITGHPIEYQVDGDYYIVGFLLKKRAKIQESCGYIRRLSAWECSYSTE